MSRSALFDKMSDILVETRRDIEKINKVIEEARGKEHTLKEMALISSSLQIVQSTTANLAFALETIEIELTLK